MTVVFVAAWLRAGPILPISGDRLAQLGLAVGIVTLLIVFLLEHNATRDVTAVQIKLEEILVALREADERKVSLEELPPEQLREIQRSERERRRAR